MTAQTPTHSEEILASDSFSRHRKQRFWQILLPVGLGGVFALAALGMVIYTAVGSSAGGPVSQWADVSTIWLLLPALLVAVIIAAILFAMVWLLARLLNILPAYTAVIQYHARSISSLIINAVDKLAAPIISVRSFSARLPGLIAALFGQRRD